MPSNEIEGIKKNTEHSIIAVDIIKEVSFLLFRLSVVDICDLLRRDTPCDQLVTNIVIHAKIAFFFKRLNLSDRLLILSIVGIFTLNRCFCCLMRYTQITEDDLREPVLSRFSVDTDNILDTAIELRIRIILK